jgi:hypothetical protein
MEFLQAESVTTVAQKLREAPSVLVRAALVNMEAGWSLNTLVIEVFPRALQEPSPSYCYNYGRYAFCSGAVSGAEASSWIQRRQGTLHGLSFQVPELPEKTSQVGKYPSHVPGGEFSVPVPWPYTRFEVSITSVNYSLQQDQAFLISEGCPFFPNFQTALFALLYYGDVSEWDQAQNRSQQGKILILQAQADAWIEYVRFSPLSVSVQIEGSQFQDTFLQVQAPPYPPFEQTVENGGSVDCPLPDGIPERVWIALARGHTWLDYLTLDQRWSPFTAKHTNMSIEQSNTSSEPPDMATQIQALIAGGEGRCSHRTWWIIRPALSHAHLGPVFDDEAVQSGLLFPDPGSIRLLLMAPSPTIYLRWLSHGNRRQGVGEHLACGPSSGGSAGCQSLRPLSVPLG